MSKTMYLVVAALVLSTALLFYKLNSANTSFENYILESKKVRNIHECLHTQCFKENFQRKGELNSKKLLAIIPERGCYECKESFKAELMDTLKKFKDIDFIELSDSNLEEVMTNNHVQFEHVTLVAIDRYKTHYVYEYHPQFPQKKAKTQALFTFLDTFNQ